jgi:hypothetical protein
VGRRAQLLVPGSDPGQSAAMIHVPPPAIELAKRFEGFHQVKKGALGRAHPYVCPAGYWTIGYGGLCYRDHPAMTEAYFAGHLRTASGRHAPALLLVDCQDRAASGDHRGLHRQPWCGSLADIYAAAADQRAGPGSIGAGITTLRPWLGPSTSRSNDSQKDRSAVDVDRLAALHRCPKILHTELGQFMHLPSHARNLSVFL